MKKSTGVYENGENCKTEKLTISPQSKIFKYKSKKMHAQTACENSKALMKKIMTYINGIMSIDQRTNYC